MDVEDNGVTRRKGKAEGINSGKNFPPEGSELKRPSLDKSKIKAFYYSNLL